MNSPCNGDQRAPSMAGKDRAKPVILQQDDIVRLSCRSLLHAGRTDRHSRDCESLGRGSLRQQPSDVSGGHMPLNDIAINHSRVARLKIVGDTGVGFDAGKIFRVMDLDGEPRRSQMPDPLAAAATAWVLIDRDLRSDSVRRGAQERPPAGQRNGTGSHQVKYGPSSHLSLHRSGFDPLEQVDQLGELLLLFRKRAALQRLFNASSGMRLEDFALDSGERTLHRLHLMQDIDTVPVGLDHADEAARLTLNPLETIDDRGPIPAFH